MWNECQKILFGEVNMDWTRGFFFIVFKVTDLAVCSLLNRTETDLIFHPINLLFASLACLP